MKRISFPFVDGQIQIPIIKFSCNDGSELLAIVDTGSESTLIDKNAIKQYPKLNSKALASGKQNFIGIAGEKDMPIIKAHICIGIDTDVNHDDRLEFDGTICSLEHLSNSVQRLYGPSFSISMLLGVDFLIKHHARIDLKKREMSLLAKSGWKN